MNTVINRLLRLHRIRKERPFQWTADAFVGLETRTLPREYYWDGLKRGGNPSRPEILFQYTLSGWGYYTENGTTRKVTPGHAFVAIIPSPHVYFLSGESPEWTFFWITIRHPYISPRLAETRARTDAILRLDAHDALLAAAVKVFEGIDTHSFQDDFAREMALFALLIEYERFVHGAAYAKPARERLLADVRAHVLANVARTIAVPELAESRGMSRSHFTHHFKSTTGLSPARFITDIRLQEVSRRLAGTHDTLKTIAAETGFADANHLCKVFRRHYHLSPGAFRRQVR